VVRGRDPQTGTIERLAARPQPTIADDELNPWAEWVAEVLPTPKRSQSSPR